MIHSLFHILGELSQTQIVGRQPSPHAQVGDICCDSRKATPESLFVCIKGFRVDGHSYAPAAYQRGTRLFLAEHPLQLPEDACQILVPDTRVALAETAAAFYGHPERKLRLIGLTGTKGKTTTALFIRRILEDADIPTGYMGTNGVDYADVHVPTVNSTPESLDIYMHLHHMLNAGMRAVVMEVSSQALWLHRVHGLTFDTCVFTNLSPDHIGGCEHPTFEHYRDCKHTLLTDYGAERVIYNMDDPSAAHMLEGVNAQTIGISTQPATASEADWGCDSAEPFRSKERLGTVYTCLRRGVAYGEEHFLALPGIFNISNALCALAVACDGFSVSLDSALSSLSRISVAGRFETVISSALPHVTFVIDYAHNGVSLASVLDALRVYKPNRLICLFGSVGGRTVGRRKDLAEAAGLRADLCILTSDNPADEPPADIIADIDAAFPEGSCPRVCITRREEAVQYAVENAEEGDIILLAGKGHETYQLIGVTRYPYVEYDVLEEALRRHAGVGSGFLF